MMRNTIIAIIISLVVIIGGMLINYWEFFNGSSATELDVLVTVVYLLTWIFILNHGVSNSNYTILKYNFIFWCLTLTTSLIVAYSNIAEDGPAGAIPLIILFYSQWYGIEFFVDNRVSWSLIVVIISLIMCLVSFIFYRQSKVRLHK